MPRWVETKLGDRAILIRESANDACLIRYTEQRGGYHWVSWSWLTRRPDLDAHPEPEWLKRARASSRPPRVLWSLLHDDDPAPLLRHFEFDTDADGRPLN